MDLTDKNLLVVAHDYTTFTKQQVDLLAREFANVVVFVRYNPVAEVSNYLPIGWLEPHRKTAKVAPDSPDNVEVHTTSLVYLPTDGGYRRLGPRHAAALRRQVRDHPLEFDLCHAHFTWTAGYAASVVATELDIPLVLTVHANRDRFLDEYENGPEGVYEAWRRADAVVRVNRRDLPRLREFTDSAYCIPNGYSRDRFPLLDPGAAREALGVAPDTDLVFSLGVLKERKGYHYLVEATADLVARRDRDLLVAIGGHGGERARLERQIREAGLEDVVRLLGFVPESDLARWMNAADVFALPSTSEGNPTVMFEALGCGTPYVGSDVGGVGEIITSDRFGLLCEPGDVAGLTDVLDAGLDREWDREAILAYGEQFTWEHVVAELLSLYEAILTGSEYEERTVEPGDVTA